MFLWLKSFPKLNASYLADLSKESGLSEIEYAAADHKLQPKVAD
jgi:hypothetical protein